MSQACPKCGAAMTAGTHDYDYDICGRTLVVRMNALVCACGETETALDTLNACELVVASHLLQQGEVRGETMRFARKSLGLTREELATRLNLEPSALQQMEEASKTLFLQYGSPLAALVAAEMSRFPCDAIAIVG